MRLKTVVVALIFSLVFLVSRASYADTLTMTGYSGQYEDYEFVYPYLFQVTGSNGVNQFVPMSCLNFDRNVNFEQPWNVDAINVSTASRGWTFLPTRTFITSIPPPTGTNRLPMSSSPSGASWTPR